ncbi:PQQ-dependent sugar dehydrogenase [Nocardiopsis sp. RSe5-2]|uniref:PQQ-dependent sugar dehydrogenase n=1 Tax=Nocardiopsis endophytica TaxID=3018445 RepID=A0ABT4U5Q6_9ACTN|nr:PQQ-dependent sugar dehydrogenase [Nocardiopsis endophytica]MDA2812279.1 PQQ-dependent sugar dehydrogenase [Nocardiopsis endophytica]
MRTRPRAPRAAAALAVLLLSAPACAGGGGDPQEADGPGEASGSGEDAAGEQERLLPPGEPETVATGLDVPWEMEFLPDGSALVGERESGRVLRVDADAGTAPEEVGTVEGVSAGGEGGLLGLAVEPGSGDGGGDVYAYYTADTENRIVRMPYTPEDGLGEQEVVADGIPKARFHNGGRIEFGPDGLLYAGTGDAGQGDAAQDTDSLAGKILRMTTDGEPAPDNPFDNLVYSYGHRNVQGLAWHGNVLLATEFGQDTWDEVNAVRPGGDHGWPEAEGEGGGEGRVDPLVVWRPPEASPSGAAVAAGSLWVAALRGERLWRLPLTGDPEDPVEEPEALFTGEFGRIRDVAAEPGGKAVWIATSNRDGRGDPAADDDRIIRIPLGE